MAIASVSRNLWSGRFLSILSSSGFKVSCDPLTPNLEREQHQDKHSRRFSQLTVQLIVNATAHTFTNSQPP
jgi:hypothetical protein